MRRFDVTPADERGTSPRSDDWAERAFVHSRLPELGCSFGLDPAGSDYSMPVEPNATTTRRVYLRPGWEGAGVPTIGARMVTGRIPPARGRDGHKVTITPDGHETDYWGLSWPGHEDPNQRPQAAAYGHAPNLIARPAPFDPRYGAVAATACEVRRADGRWYDLAHDTGTGPDAFICSPLSLGVTHATEVASGVIRHALRMSIGNPMSGPAAPDWVVDIDDPLIGNEYGAAGLPCGTHEGAKRRRNLETAVPHGLHLQVCKTTRELDAWLDARRYTGLLREVARVFATATTTHGIIALLSTLQGAAPTIQANGADAKAWQKLGITGTGRNLLAGWIDSPACLRVLAWPTAQLPDGRTTNRAGQHLTTNLP